MHTYTHVYVYTYMSIYSHIRLHDTHHNICISRTEDPVAVPVPACPRIDADDVGICAFQCRDSRQCRPGRVCCPTACGGTTCALPEPRDGELASSYPRSPKLCSEPLCIVRGLWVCLRLRIIYLDHCTTIKVIHVPNNIYIA